MRRLVLGHYPPEDEAPFDFGFCEGKIFFARKTFRQAPP